MEDFEQEITVTIAGAPFVLRYWAMNYGTHVGSTLRLIEAASGAKAIDLSFECHWNAPGRYILRQGAAAADPAFAFAADGLRECGLAVMRALAGHYAAGTSLNDVYARIKAGTGEMLAQCKGILAGS